jgi:hypothetical protein
VRGRLDWKYALGLELTDDGFDASVLSEFRSRLACEEAAGRVLELLLDRLAEEGLLAAGGRQRTDATCVLAAICNLNRLELVTETMRAALEAVTACAPGWLAALAPPPWYERYAQRASDYRLPRTHATRDAHAMTVGRDGYLLLDAIYRADAPPWLRQVPAVQVLRRVWVQRYYRQEETVRWRGKGELPSSSVLIVNPYDTDARYSVKRGVGWEGCKAHFTEICDADRPHLIVHATTTVATTTDVETTPIVHAELARRDLLPAEHYVDAGYVSVDQIIEARDRYGVDLVGPLPPDSGWQAYDPDAFDITHFTIDWDNEQVICPHGKASRNWRQALSRNGLPIIQVTFRKPDCDPCPDRARCTRARATARNMTFRPQAKFEEQHRVRAQQATEAWQERYALRSGIESTISQGSRRCDLHRSRYRGLVKTRLQQVLTATALNLVRIDTWLAGIPPGGSRPSRFVRLQPATYPT